MIFRQWPSEVWLLIAIPGSAIMFGVLMLVMALIHPDDLVVDDYYKEGMAINRQLSMRDKSELLSLRGSLQLTDEVQLQVRNATDSTIALNLYHVTSRVLDRRFLMVPDAVGSYVGDDPALFEVLSQPGIWHLELVGLDDGWKLSQRIVTPVTSVELNP